MKLEMILDIMKIRLSIFWIYFIFAFFLLPYFGCTGSAGEKKEATETKMMNRPPPQSRLSPGTMKIEASVIRMTKINNHYECVVKVENVLGYGMSAKPVAPGSELSLQISDHDEDFIKLLSGGTISEKFELTVEHAQMVDNQFEWRVLKITNTNHNQ